MPDSDDPKSAIEEESESLDARLRLYPLSSSEDIEGEEHELGFALDDSSPAYPPSVPLPDELSWMLLFTSGSAVRFDLLSCFFRFLG